MAVQKFGVEFEGLAQLRRGLNRVDKQLTKELRSELVSIGRTVAADARARVPQRTGVAAASIRAGMSGNTAYIAGGKRAVPYYGWLDFGSRTPRRGNSRQQGPWRGSGAGPKRGRFIYPAIEKNRAYIARAAQHAAERALDRAIGGP